MAASAVASTSTAIGLPVFASSADVRSLALAAVGAASPGRERANVAARGRLVLRNIDVNFPGSSMQALRDVSLTCAPGEFVVVVGPSGCGKSTLLGVAAGMLKQAKGAVELDGQRSDGPSPDRAMVFQDHGLFPWLTTAQNIEFGLKMLKVDKNERASRVDAALQLVHLQTKRDKLIHELSGGMRQRVAIARALVMDPAVLLMDEPFAALDAQTRTLLHGQLQEIWAETKKTILFVTHSVGEAVRLADRIIVLHSHPGRIRREVIVPLAHPRNPDNEDISEITRIVRKEIEDEVNRVNAEMAEEYWNPQASARLGVNTGMLGDGI
ncbi:MAG TPA: ABC transporter ATP-binding protein [Tepidisphaeraceae bacterium]|jgi:NitT/TauT family transport system ATP-binding protein|nr:ABC transporter ATP-binding protein [Tepidisphaeraceae bacterium]